MWSRRGLVGILLDYQAVRYMYIFKYMRFIAKGMLYLLNAISLISQKFLKIETFCCSKPPITLSYKWIYLLGNIYEQIKSFVVVSGWQIPTVVEYMWNTNFNVHYGIFKWYPHHKTFFSSVSPNSELLISKMALKNFFVVFKHKFIYLRIYHPLMYKSNIQKVGI